MKSKTAALGSILLICLGVFVLGAREPEDKSWHFVRPEISLGTLTRDQAVPVTFEIRNDRDISLKIVSTDVSCRCISLDSAPDEVPPHRSGVFRWTFNAARSSGSVKDTISITGDDGRTLVGTFNAMVSEDAPISR